MCHSDLVGKSRTRAAAIIWLVGAAVVGAVAGGLHLLRSQIGGAHQGLSITLSAFGLTALAAFMLFHGVMLAAQAQDAVAGPDPLDDEDEDEDDVDQPDGLGEPFEARGPAATRHEDEADEVDDQTGASEPDHDEPGARVDEPAAAVADEPEREDARARGDDTAYDRSAAEAGPAVYTFRRGKPVREPARGIRPPQRDRPA